MRLRNGLGRLASALALLVWLAGCATPQLARLNTQPPPGLPPVAEVAALPFFAQDVDQCGPAALAMVARFAGVAVTPEQLRPQVFLPDRRGSLQLEMLATTRRQGLLAWPLPPKLEAVLRQVAAGRPVVVLQNLSLPVAPLWHYAVVTGYDLPAQTLRLHSGLQADLDLPLATFEHTWARSGHWAFVALSPGQVPADAEPQAWLQAAAATERVRPDAAGQAYEAATRTWPGEARAWLGLGNVRYGEGRLDQAGEAFEAATRADPALADAWNNLAQLRLAQQRRSEAAEAIDRAVALGGPHLARYLELQQQLRPAPAP